MMLEIGKIVNTHGLNGEMTMTAWCDGISFLKSLKVVYINNKEYKLVNVKAHKNVYIIKLLGIDNINDTPEFINKIVYVSRQDLPDLPKNTYYIKDIIGLNVYNNNEFVGKIVDVFSTPANDVYVVNRQEKKQVLIPAVKETIKNISVENGRMDVNLAEEYFDEN